MSLKFVSTQAEEMQQQGSIEPCRAGRSGPTPIRPSPSMDLKKDGLPPAVRPVLPPGRTDWTVRNTDCWCLFLSMCYYSVTRSRFSLVSRFYHTWGTLY